MSITTSPPAPDPRGDSFGISRGPSRDLVDAGTEMLRASGAIEHNRTPSIQQWNRFLTARKSLRKALPGLRPA